MANFDPDKFLTQTSAPAESFDPDVFLAQTSSPDRVKSADPTLGAPSTGAFHFARHLSFGLGDKIIAGEQAVADWLRDKTGKVSVGDAYRRNLAFNDQLLEASDTAHPVARWAGNVGGFAGNLAAMALAAPAQAARAAPTLGQAAGQGAKLGAVLGGAGGFGTSRAESLPEALGDTALGAGLGAGFGAATPYAANYLGRGFRAVGDKVRDLAGWLKVNSIHPSASLGGAMADIPGGVPAVGRELLEKGIGGATKQKTAEQISEAFAEATTKANSLAAASQASGKIVDLSKAFRAAQTRANALLKEPATQEAGTRLQALIDQYASKYGGATSNTAIAEAGAVEALATKRALGTLGYGATAEFKINKNPAVGDFAKGVQLLERGFNEALEAHLGPEFSAANLLVRRLGGALQAAEHGAAKTTGNSILGFLPYLGALSGAGIGHATGEATPAALAIGLSTLLMGKYGSQGGARALYSPVAGSLSGIGGLLNRTSGPASQLAAEVVGEQGVPYGKRLADLVGPGTALAEE